MSFLVWTRFHQIRSWGCFWPVPRGDPSLLLKILIALLTSLVSANAKSLQPALTPHAPAGAISHPLGYWTLQMGCGHPFAMSASLYLQPIILRSLILHWCVLVAWTCTSTCLIAVLRLSKFWLQIICPLRPIHCLRL